MHPSRRLIATLLLLPMLAAADIGDGYWTEEAADSILEATLGITLDPDLEHLSSAEHAALQELLGAGQLMHELYETQMHREARAARDELLRLHANGAEPARTAKLRTLYYLFKGPIATTLANERLAFLPVGAEQPGKNVYPHGLDQAQMAAYLEARPADRERLLALRSVVRRSNATNIAADLKKLDDFPGVAALHPALRSRLEGLEPGEDGLYALPYALAYAETLQLAREHLDRAADLVAAESPDFAAYLENRSRDFISGDYEAGDASWVSGDFANLNIQIGAYETYDDSLLGAKAFYSASILVRDKAKSAALQAVMTELQSIEDALPYKQQKPVRSRIPVGVYNVVADFGQARGANTATILPNEADHNRKYGRTILIRNNILSNPELFANAALRFRAALANRYGEHLTADGKFNRTLWHEVGHYLGVSRSADGRSLNIALADRADLFEELKSDLVSLSAAPLLLAAGYYDADGMQSHYADGVRRTLQLVQPRPTQPYQNMQLMQFNYFLEHGLLGVDGESGRLSIDYERYPAVVRDMLREVLAIQYEGDAEAAGRFVERWNYWSERLHGQLASRMQDAGGYRKTMVNYRALVE